MQVAFAGLGARERTLIGAEPLLGLWTVVSTVDIQLSLAAFLDDALLASQLENTLLQLVVLDLHHQV